MPTVLEDYFDFSDPEEIRIQGHRVWLHHVLLGYRERKETFEDLCESYPSLGPEKVAACLLYYHRYQEKMDPYLDDLKALFQRQREESFRKYGNSGAELRARMLAAKASQPTP